MNSKKRFRSAPTNSRFAGLGKRIYRYRIWILVIWIFITVISLASAPLLEKSLQEVKVVDETGEAERTEQLLQQEFSVDPNALTLVFQQSGAASSASIRMETAIETTLNSIRDLPQVEQVSGPNERPDYRSPGGQVQYSIIELKSQGNLSSEIAQIEQVLAQNSAQTVKTYLTGKPVIDREVQRISKADLRRVELWVLPITLGVLILVFGSVVAAAMPVAIGIVAVSVTLGLLYVVSLRLSVSVFALNLTSMLGLGLGIDYALLIVKRFQQELRTQPVEQAVSTTVETAGRAVFFSGLTVCISLFGLMLFPIRLLQSLGIAGAIVVSFSVLSALTLLPALLSIVGHKIHYGSVFSVADKTQTFWRRIARVVIRHSVLAAAVVLLIVAGLTAPFFTANYGVGNADILPPANSARAGVEVLDNAFGPGETAPILLAVQTESSDDILSPEHIATLYSFVSRLQRDPRVDGVQSLVNLDPKLNLEGYQQLYSRSSLSASPEVAAIARQLSHDSTTLVVVKSGQGSHEKASRELVRDLRGADLTGLKVQVGGQTASELDTIAAIQRRLPMVLTVIGVVTFIVLGFLLNSIVLPLKAIVMNLLSMGASFGALVFIFQRGNFQTVLRFMPVGYLDVLLPVVLFCVLFGLSMDYEVFLLTRIKETYDSLRFGPMSPDENNTASVISGLEQTGQLITSAALLVILVTSAFAFTSLIFVKALGLGIAIAIAVDATLIRVIFVPATMKLMGKWNWWTPW